jgi:hypothetical protein
MRLEVTFLLVIIISIAGCASKTPMPTERFKAIGNYTHKAGADEIAMEKAKDFCDNWNAAVGVIEQSTTYNGKLLTEEQQEGIDMIKNSIPIIDGWGNKNAYQTTIIYKCY